jgi:translation initiation factor IF-3
MQNRLSAKLWTTKNSFTNKRKETRNSKRFGPQTDEHDYEFKRKNAEKFLKEGSKLKAFVFFKGRSIIYKEQGQILLLRLAQDLEEHGKVEAMPVLEGKRMTMYIAPKKKK